MILQTQHFLHFADLLYINNEYQHIFASFPLLPYFSFQSIINFRKQTVFCFLQKNNYPEFTGKEQL